jgi:hypothetical protein
VTKDGDDGQRSSTRGMCGAGHGPNGVKRGVA